MNLGVLGPDCLGGQVSEENAGIGAEGEANATRRAQAKGNAAVDPLEPVALRPAMGEGCEDLEARHEAKRTGRQGVYGLKREEVH